MRLKSDAKAYEHPSSYQKSYNKREKNDENFIVVLCYGFAFYVVALIQNPDSWLNRL